MASSRYRKIKTRSIRRKKIIILLITISLLFISGGYSYLNSELGFSGTLIVNQYNSNDDIRIDNIELIDKKNNGNEINNPNYSSNRTGLYVSLPNTNSSLTYRVTIKNNTNYYFTPGEIKTIVNTNSNVKYTISGLESYGVYQGESLTFTITVTTSLSSQEANITIGYDLNLITENTWTFDYKGYEQTLPIMYSTTYQLEVWGAQGGYAYTTTYRGGYGGYAIGDISLTKGKNLYINVGGQGQSNTIINVAAEGGYNGGGSSILQNNDITAGGGGATHIATKSGKLATLSESISDILIVAGGGGGGYYYTVFQGYGGEGGGEAGLQGRGSGDYKDLYTGYGGTQTEGGEGRNHAGSGSFGLGGNSDTNGGAGGGGGYFGGAAAYGAGAGGGSGYIGNTLLKNKRMYCYNCDESTNENSLTSKALGSSSTAKSKYAKEGNGYVIIKLLPIN